MFQHELVRVAAGKRQEVENAWRTATTSDTDAGVCETSPVDVRRIGVHQCQTEVNLENVLCGTLGGVGWHAIEREVRKTDNDCKRVG